MTRLYELEQINACMHIKRTKINLMLECRRSFVFKLTSAAGAPASGMGASVGLEMLDLHRIYT